MGGDRGSKPGESNAGLSSASRERGGRVYELSLMMTCVKLATRSLQTDIGATLAHAQAMAISPGAVCHRSRSSASAEPFDGPFGRTFSFRDPDGYVLTAHEVS